MMLELQIIVDSIKAQITYKHRLTGFILPLCYLFEVFGRHSQHSENIRICVAE